MSTRVSTDRTYLVVLNVFLEEVSDGGLDTLRVADIGEMRQEIVLDPSHGIVAFSSLRREDVGDVRVREQAAVPFDVLVRLAYRWRSRCVAVRR